MALNSALFCITSYRQRLRWWRVRHACSVNPVILGPGDLLMATLSSPFGVFADRRLRLLGPVVLFLVGVAFFRLRMYLLTPGTKLPILVTVALVCGYVGWELARLTALFIQYRLPGLSRVRQRLFLLIVSVVLISHAGFLLRNVVHGLIGSYPLQWPTLLDYSTGLGVLIYYATVTLAIYEGAYLWQQWRTTSAEKENLIQLEWQARFDLLKNQINPHFLFNSLNVLSSLIGEDPVKAEQFTNELSKVYRYLMQRSNEELVPLSSELRFIESYAHLLQTRYGDSFQLVVEVDEGFNDDYLPALTLQLLVENAVKHNVVSREQPLTVYIRSRGGGWLSVENRIQKKAVRVLSTGVGLANIRHKFMLLKLEGIQVEEVEGIFRVGIPLGRK